MDSLINLSTIAAFRHLNFVQAGSWIWIYGPKELFTLEVRTLLKQKGFRFSRSKMAWYLPPEGTPYRNGKFNSVREVEDEHGRIPFRPKQALDFLLNDKS